MQRIAISFRKNKLADLYENTARIRANLSLALQLHGKESQRLSKLQSWLEAPNAADNHLHSRQKHYASTGEWFLNGNDFIKWLKTPNSFLWVHGAPGCGKSVLFSTAVEYIKSSQVNGDQDVGLAFFYFDFKDSSKQSALGMLCALLLQLSDQVHVDDFAKDLGQLNYTSKSGTTPLDVDDPIACLHRVAQRFPKIYILLDALDECPHHKERETVLAFIATVRQWGLPALHILVTSHDVIDIRGSLNPQEGQDVTMKNPNVDKDMANYVYHQLTTNPNLEQWKDNHVEIQAALIERAQGVFLYVASQLQQPLKEAQILRDLDTVLEDLPLDMHETYERLLRGVGMTNTENVRRIMTLLCYSNRPLTGREVCHALAVDLRNPARLDLEKGLLTERKLRKICGSLIEITQTKIITPFKTPAAKIAIVNIAHSLVQQYLESDAIRRHEVAAFAIDRVSANRELAQICLVYLKSALSDETTGQRDEKFPFAPFAAMEWFHYYAACQNKDSDLKDLAFDLFHDGKGGCFSAWVDLNDVDTAWGTFAISEQVMHHRGPPIYYASLLGLDDIAERIVATDCDINAQGGRYGNALRVASLKGHTAVVQVLLKYQADVNIQSGECGTALLAASLTGHKDVVDVLLSHNADVNIQSGDYGTALQAASCKGHKEVVQALLKSEADINAQGGRYGNALRVASLYGHKEVMQLLLEHGAQISPNGLSQELQTASIRGDEKRVDELLNLGQQISNDHVQIAIDSALLYASLICHENAVKLLLKKGANVNARGGNLGNPLYCASLTQREMLGQAAYQFLREGMEGFAVKTLTAGNARAASLMSPILHEEGSIRRLFEIMTAMFVDDLSTNGSPQGDALLNLALENSEKVVEILLANGADVNARGGKYSNALQAASHIGNEKAVKILLAKGADVNAKGGFHGSALKAALAGGHKRVEQI
ncbi:NACHT nucleoside triphosphatase [Penicillium canariense]|uniref:NACHT nucleoside triphosphatase n=1 Tax=Penicillium canariense TaxID=189055 RepID=A0A9W9LIT0_9EURO|nr:NACHT nucleoside triphosphatase [Penicillium canariense]KAJ5157603.1 NACHT nucleoside triphosphatase [Penicillium canariense]